MSGVFIELGSEKRRCLTVILALEPGNQWARAAMEWVEGRTGC